MGRIVSSRGLCHERFNAGRCARIVSRLAPPPRMERLLGRDLRHDVSSRRVAAPSCGTACSAPNRSMQTQPVLAGRLEVTRAELLDGAGRGTTAYQIITPHLERIRTLSLGPLAAAARTLRGPTREVVAEWAWHIAFRCGSSQTTEERFSFVKSGFRSWQPGVNRLGMLALTHMWNGPVSKALAA